MLRSKRYYWRRQEQASQVERKRVAIFLTLPTGKDCHPSSLAAFLLDSWINIFPFYSSSTSHFSRTTKKTIMIGTAQCLALWLIWLIRRIQDFALWRSFPSYVILIRAGEWNLAKRGCGLRLFCWIDWPRLWNKLVCKYLPLLDRDHHAFKYVNWRGKPFE